MLEIITQSERRLVNDAGEITRAACDWKFSGGWKMLGLVRPHGWGQAEYILFRDVSARLKNGLQLRYKNGKPRFTVRDSDHGTTREWGDMVLEIRELGETA